MSIVNLNYGHNGSGKLYSYEDKTGTRRAGDVVVIEVTDKNGKTYKTLGKIRSTHGSGTVGEGNTKNFLNGMENSQGGKGVGLKEVLGGSKQQLPGFEKFRIENEKDPSAAWQRDSNQRKKDADRGRLDADTRNRLISMEV